MHHCLHFPEDRFRENLLGIERENTELKARVQELESMVNDANSDTGKMQRRIRSLEKANDVLTKTTTAYEQEKRHLEKEVNFFRSYVRRICHVFLGSKLTVFKS